ncbi:hypothetical protein V6N13_014652 [Hibiscus sabdariffa]
MSSSSLVVTDWRKLFAANVDQSLEFFPPVVTGGPPNFSALQKLVNLLWGKISPVELQFEFMCLGCLPPALIAKGCFAVKNDAPSKSSKQVWKAKTIETATPVVFTETVHSDGNVDSSIVMSNLDDNNLPVLLTML